MKPQRTFYLLVAAAILILAGAAGYILLGVPRNPPVETELLVPKPGNEGTDDHRTDDSEDGDTRDFTIAGIVPADSAEKVLELHGEPLNKKTQSEQSIHNSDYVSYWTTWTYDGFEVLFMTVAEKGKNPAGGIGGVFSVKVTAGRYKTHRGIKVGDPASRVRDQYGQDENAYFSKGENELFFETGLSYIRFAVSEGKVIEIEAGQVLN